MQHKVKATGQTGKYVDDIEEKILLELPGETYSDQPILKWFDKDELELLTQQPEVAAQPQTLPAIVKEKKPAVKKKVVSKKVSK